MKAKDLIAILTRNPEAEIYISHTDPTGYNSKLKLKSPELGDPTLSDDEDIEGIPSWDPEQFVGGEYIGPKPQYWTLDRTYIGPLAWLIEVDN